MSANNSIGGPVSAALEADVRTWVRKHGIVVWLDGPGDFTGFVDRLRVARQAGDLTYEVKAFRGSYLETLLDLDGVADGAEKTPLLVHLPGFNEQSVVATPLYELYEAGTRYRKRLDTLVTEAATGQVRPEAIAAFIATGSLSLDIADEWLVASQSGAGGGVAAELLTRTATDIVDDLLSAGSFARRLDRPEVVTAIWNRLAATLGLSDAWREACGEIGTPAEHIASTVAGWAMAVEYAKDLTRQPSSPLLAGAAGMPAGVIEACVALASHLRHRHPDFYRRAADDAEGILADERAAARAADLGDVDTFRFEEDNVFSAAVTALEAKRFAEAGRYASARLSAGATSGFWARAIPGREPAWRLIEAAARLGSAIEAAGSRLSVDGGFEGVATVYATRGAAVDRAHRHLEQSRSAAIVAHPPEFERLRGGLEAARLTYRDWADAWARDFSEFCKTHGFLPDTSLQQRTLFDDVVKPLVADDGPTAYFVIDALRFEMAEELLAAFEAAPGTTAKLTVRFAELPSVTEVGMNVLAPVARSGRLAAASGSDGGGLSGFSTGEFRVHDPETRRRAMHDRVGGPTCPKLSLDEVVDKEPASLKRSIGRSRLVVVHGREIDVAGEAGVSLDEFDKAIRKLRAAWLRLREVGVRRFVVASDHGFLLPMGPLAKVQPHGRRSDPKPRYAFAPVAAATAGEVAVSLSDLGYESAEGCVVFPESTALFDTGGRPPLFVHGGNSLQERIVPVLTAVHRSVGGTSTIEYGLTVAARAGVAGMHCVEATLAIASQTAMDFHAIDSIELALRAPEDDAVRVEICDVRGAVHEGSAIRAPVGRPFEVFFRLLGPTDTRVLVELHHPGVDARVKPGGPDARFAVTPAVPSREIPAPAITTRTPVDEVWLASLPEGGIRQVFAHLAAHGAVTEAEISAMMGGGRGVRRFALQFDTFAPRAPFRVRIDNVAGVKRYVREGGER